MTTTEIIKHLTEDDSYKENLIEIIGLYFIDRPDSLAEWKAWFEGGAV